MKSTSVLIKDLTNVPNIIASLGLGVATAQKAFNLSYLESLEKLFSLAKQVRSSEDSDDFKEIFNDIIKAMAPSRYQFTETSIAVRMDLAQSLQETKASSLGLSVGAITVNAAFTQAFAYDYRAAAEVKAVLHAVNFDANAMNSLLARVEELASKDLSLPEEMAEADVSIMVKSAEIYKKLTGKEVPKLEVESPNNDPDQ